MKIYFIALLAMLMGWGLHAQTGNPPCEAAILKPIDLEITYHKTTLLIFPAPVTRAPRGDHYVLAEKVPGAENVLQVKAGQQGFEESNLQVITADGKVYPFTVHYAERPGALTIDLRRQPPYAPVIFSGVSLNSREMELYAVMARARPFMKCSKYSGHGMDFMLRGIYLKGDVLFFHYVLKNHSQLPYDLQSLRFFVRDKKKARRTAVQDRELVPLYVGKTGTPENPAGQSIVVAFPKFTIAEKKYFIAELMEKDGDRNPFSKLDQRRLLKARTLQ